MFWQFIANFVVKKFIVMKPVLDLHTHTIMSGHAFSTLQEMVCAARDKGLEYLGISDHGPAVPGACDPIYFRNLYVGQNLTFLIIPARLIWIASIVAGLTMLLPACTVFVIRPGRKGKTQMLFWVRCITPG